MARSPYLLKDGSHILSKFGERVGTTPRVWEFRFNMNGWRAQHLIHNAANFSEVTVADLSAYANDKKVKPVSHAVDAVLATIRGSVPLGFARTFDKRTAVTGGLEGYGQKLSELDIARLAAECERLEKDNSVFRMYLQEGNAVAPSLASGIWSIWSPTAKPYVITNKFRETRGFDIDTSRFDDPIGKFKQLVADKLRIPMSQIHFVGRGYPTTNWSNIAPEWSVYLSGPHGNKGFTTLFSPRDIQGYHGIFVIPKIPGIRAAVVASRLGYKTGGKYTLRFAGKDVDLALVDESGVVPGHSTSVGPYMSSLYEKAYASYKLVPDVAPVAGTITPEMAGIDAAAHLMLGSPTYVCKGANGEWGEYVDGCDLSYIRAKDLFYAVPNGFGSVILDAPGVSSVDVSPDYGDVIGVQPVKACATLKMQSIRAYILAKSKTPGLTPTEVATLTKGLKDSEKYSDALLYCTVYHNGWEFPSKSRIGQLGIVQAAADADKDLMSEDLGQGETLNKVGAKFDKFRLEGKRAFAAVSMVDDALTAEDVVSPFLAARFEPWLWVVRPIFTDGEIVAYRGVYSGGSEESLTRDDALALIANYSPVQLPVGLTIEQVYADLGVEEGKMPTFAAMYGPAAATAGARAYDGMRDVQKIAMSPVDFRDVLGFPVLDIMDDDSRFRAMIVLKGLGEDMQGMFLTLFFLNQMDVV